MKTKIMRLDRNRCHQISRQALVRICMAAAVNLFCGLINSGYGQVKDCKDCDIGFFQSFTTYYTVQPGSLVGFGLEGGNWNKERSRFSYFLGAKMHWFQYNAQNAKFSNPAENIRFAFYLKGQARIINRLYLLVTPQFVNLHSFEAGLGFRFTYPLSEVIAVGIEPTYGVVLREFSLNANFHFSL